MALCLYRCYIRWWHHHPMIYRTGDGIASHSPWVGVGLACMSPPSVSPNYRQIHCLLVWGVNVNLPPPPSETPVFVWVRLSPRLHESETPYTKIQFCLATVMKTHFVSRSGSALLGSYNFHKLEHNSDMAFLPFLTYTKTLIKPNQLEIICFSLFGYTDHWGTTSYQRYLQRRFPSWLS